MSLTSCTSKGNPSAEAPTAIVNSHEISTPMAIGSLGGLHVDGTLIENEVDTPVLLFGFDDSAASTCIQSDGSVFVNRMPAQQQASYVRPWNGNTVRISLNEDCWLGINGAPKSFPASTYQSTIVTAVDELNAAGYYVILDLHWNAPGNTLAKGQEVMADADHTPTFWQSVAETFASNHDVLFELYNEPHGISWSCWEQGCAVPQGWQAAGMQSLVDAVRSTGARQILLLGGLGYSNDLSEWLQYEPHDPDGSLAAALHVHNVDACVDPTCWNATVAPVAKVVPVVATEIGERDPGSGMVDSFISWASQYHIGYLGWENTPPYAATLKHVYAAAVRH